jgi:DNA repair protein RecO (recombination protein O)
MTKTRAIVLHSLKYGEKKLIVDVFTKDEGRLTFLTSIPQSNKSKIKKQFFIPLTILDIEFTLHKNRQFQHFDEIAIVSSPSMLQANQSKLAISFFIAEFLYHATKGEQAPNSTLFIYIEESLRWLEAASDNFANFHLVFMMRFTRFIGFFPNVEQYHDGDFFDLRDGVFVSLPPLHRDVLLPNEASLILSFMRMNYANMGRYQLSHVERNRIIDIVLSYYRLHVPGFPELKSLDILRSLF